jgi:calcium-dependent protein kinase
LQVQKETTETASTENITKYYIIGDVIGCGSFGKVRLAKSMNENSRIFAVKTIHRARLKEKGYMLRRELEILKTLDHPNIIKFYEIF